VGNWTFCPFVTSPASLIQRFLLIFLLIQLKNKHHRLDVLTIFQRGARGAVSRDTLYQTDVMSFRLCMATINVCFLQKSHVLLYV